MGFEKFGLVSYVSQTRVSKFIEYLEDGKVYGTKCRECGAVHFPPRAHCARCLSNKFDWAQLSGDCTLITHTKVEVAPATFKEEAPYILGLAQLSEGPRIFAWIDKHVPEEQISIGMKLQLKTMKLPNGNLLYTLTKVADA